MQIDKAKLAAQIAAQKRRLEKLEMIASDPELLTMLESIAVNGDGSVPLHGMNHSVVTVSAIASEKPKKGAQLAAIQAAVMKRETPFSGYELADQMQTEGYPFKAKPGLATIEGLKTLTKKGLVRVHRKGKGSEPTLYTRILQQ